MSETREVLLDRLCEAEARKEFWRELLESLDDVAAEANAPYVTAYGDACRENLVAVLDCIHAGASKDEIGRSKRRSRVLADNIWGVFRALVEMCR